MNVIENTLRALLADKNIPARMAERALETLLDSWSNLGSDASVVEHSLDNLLWRNSEMQLVGPRAGGLPKVVRVSRVLSLRALARLLGIEIELNNYIGVLSGRWSEVENLDPATLESVLKFIQAHLAKISHAQNISSNSTSDDWPTTTRRTRTRRTHSRLLPSRPLAWVGLRDELVGTNLNELLDGFGITHFAGGQPIVAISYTIDSSDLHVPTIFDAGLVPTFVSKPASLSGPPRAWDWKRQQWGFAEMIHRPDATFHKPEVHWLGLTPQHGGFSYGGFTEFVPPQSAVIERVVAQALTQVAAHKDLEAFLSGATSLLEISALEFEHFIATLYSRQGYKTTVTKQSRDGGFDVIVLSDFDCESGLLIQAKRSRGTVGIRVVRELIGARFLADIKKQGCMLVVATTGRFSRPAREAQEQHLTELCLQDYDDLQLQLRKLKGVGMADIAQRAVAKSREEGR